MLSGSACRGLVTLLPKHHILGGKPAYFDEQLAGSRPLSPPVEQTPLRLTYRRTKVLLTPLLFATLFRGRVPISTILCDFVFHYSSSLRNSLLAEMYCIGKKRFRFQNE